MNFSQQHPIFRLSPGFSLIEMAVVLVILGLIVGTVTPLLVSQIKQEKVSKGREVVRQARDEVIGYALRHTNSSAGTSCLPPSDGDHLHTSYVAHIEDPWNQKISYYPADNTNGTGKNCFNCSDSSVGNQTIQGIYDKGISGVAFTLVSSGDDFEQQTTYNSIDDIVYANKTHDIVEFVSRNYLCGKFSSDGGGGGGSDTGVGRLNNPDVCANFRSSGKCKINDLEEGWECVPGMEDGPNCNLWRPAD